MKKLTIILILVLSVSTAYSQPIPSYLMRFLRLVDTPSTYTDQADELLQVNSGESAIEFTPLSNIKTDMSLNLVENTALSTWAGTANITILGTIVTGVWQGTDVGVAYGGTGASTLADGFVLLGNGTGAIQALDVTTDGGIIIGDGTTDPVVLDVGSSTAITILGTIATGVWQGTAIADTYVDNNITIDLATLATTVTVSDDESTDDDQEIVFTTNNANLESDGDFHYSPDTGTVTATEFIGGGSGLTGIFTAWDNIGNPDADDTIALAGYEVGFSSTLDEADHVAFIIDHTDADVTAATTIFQIQSVDISDADLTYIRVIDDSGGTPNTIFRVAAGGIIQADGTMTLNDGSGDSPGFQLVDGDTQYFIMLKADTGEAIIRNTEGAIHIKPSADLDDYLSISTASGIVTIATVANDDGDLVITAGGGDISFGDDNLTTTGRVGIGTASPAEILELRSVSPILRIRATGSTASNTAAYVEFGGTTNSVFNRTGYVGDSVSGDTHIRLRAEDSDLWLGDSDSETVLVLSGGDVTASGALTVSGSLTVTGSLTVGGSITVGSFIFTDQTPVADGEISFDTDGDGSTVTAGVVDVHDGTEVVHYFGSAGYPTGDNQIQKYDAGTNKVVWEADASAGTTAYDDIADPDAAGSISFDDTETATYTTVQDTAGSFISFINSNADISNQVYMLDLDYSVDTTQDNADFIRLQDAGSTLVVFEEEGKMTMTPSGVDDAMIISITPSAALTQAEVAWYGIKIDGDALDPGDFDNTVIGIDVDLSGVVLTKFPYVEALELIMPAGGVALHIEEGKIKQEFTSGSDAGAEYTAIDMFMDASNQAANSETHAIDVAVVGGDPAGLVVGLGTHTYVAPVHQHIGVFSTPDQAGADSEAGFFDNSATDYIDGVDGVEQFSAVDDAIWISAATVFTEIEVIMGTPASRSITPTFWYWKDLGTDAWTEFFPADDTDGFQQSGTIRFETAAVADWLSADVVNISAGDAGEAAAGYWIAIIRTANANPGTPTPTTVKTGAITEFFWDETGAIDVLSIEADTITEGGVAVITEADMPAAGTDPDVDAAGEIGRDTDGANETGDSSLRGNDGSNQFLYSRKLKTLNFTLIEPDQIDAYDLIPIWHNTSGMTFTIVEWKAWSDDDNVSFEIEELTNMTDFTAITLVDACEIDNDGTSVFIGSDTEITHGAIEHDHSLAIDFDGANDTPDYVQIVIIGWFNSDVN